MFCQLFSLNKYWTGLDWTFPSYSQYLVNQTVSMSAGLSTMQTIQPPILGGHQILALLFYIIVFIWNFELIWVWSSSSPLCVHLDFTEVGRWDVMRGDGKVRTEQKKESLEWRGPPTSRLHRAAKMLRPALSILKGQAKSRHTHGVTWAAPQSPCTCINLRDKRFWSWGFYCLIAVPVTPLTASNFKALIAEIAQIALSI